MIFRRTVTNRRKDDHVFKAVFENASDGILLAALPSRKLVMSNPAIRRMLGYTEEEILQLSVDQIHPAHDLPFILDQFHRQVEGGIRTTRFTPVLRKDGTVFYADIAATPIASGGKDYLIGFFRDMTELKDVENHLRKSIRKLQTLNHITAEISSSLETDTVFKEAVELSASLIGGDGGTLAIYDFEKNRMTYPYHFNMPAAMSRTTAGKGRGLAEQVMRQGAMIIADYPGHPAALPEFVEAGVRVLIAVPLASKGRNVGALGIYGFSKDKEFASEDLKILEAVGRQVGVAVENARLYEKTKRDMAEIERIGRNLRRSEEKFRNLVESVNDWIWEVDADGRYTYVSPRVRDLLGYEPEEILGKTPFDLMPPQEAEKVKPEFLKSGAAVRSFSGLENWNRHKKGYLVLMETSGTALIDRDGRLTGYRGVDRDITEMKRAQAALKKSEEKFRGIVVNSFDVILTMDPAGILTYVSPAIRRLAGYDPEEMIGTDFRHYFPESDAEKIEDVIGRLKEKQAVQLMEIRMQKTDATHLHIELNASPLIEDDSVAGSQLIFRDISEKKRLEEQLRQKQKIEAIGTLTAGITHDFNNVLGIIIGNTELALNKISPEDPFRDNLDKIMTASFRARAVVRQLLQFSRASEEERRPIAPVPVIRESLHLMKATIPTMITVRENYSETCESLIADPTHLQQIIINLCTNAVHAMSDKGGLLEVSVECGFFDKEALGFDADLAPGNYVRLTVSDTGHGMTPALMERIFDPYFTTKAINEGSGMGLAVVHGIVRSYGGGIDISSFDGGGATFRIYLPAAGNVETDDPGVSAVARRGHERILYVDDEPMLVEMWKELLTPLGYAVETATDPEKALETFSSAPERFDMVVTDMSMPKITGDRLAGQMLAIRPDIPIIICTGFNQKLDADRARQLGIAGYLEKPLKLDMMVEKIRTVLDGDAR